MFPSSHQNLPTIPSTFSPGTCECIHVKVVGSLGSKIRFCGDLRIDLAAACNLRWLLRFIKEGMIFPIDGATFLIVHPTLPIDGDNFLIVHPALSIGGGNFLIEHASLPIGCAV